MDVILMLGFRFVDSYCMWVDLRDVLFEIVSIIFVLCLEVYELKCGWKFLKGFVGLFVMFFIDWVLVSFVLSEVWYFL